MNNLQKIKLEKQQEVLSNVESMPQRQDSTRDQLLDLIVVAEKLGMYDAADYLKDQLDLR